MNKRHGLSLVLILLSGCTSSYEKGVETFDAEKYEEAISLLEKVQKSDTDFDRAQSKISAAYFKLGEQAFNIPGKYEEAISLLEKVQKSDTDFDRAQDKINAAYYNLGEQAFRSIEKQEGTDDEWLTVLSYFGKVKTGSSVYPQTQEKINEVHFRLGKQAFDKYQWKVALEQMAKVTVGSKVYDQAQKLILEAQTAAQTATITGTILSDSSGKPVPDVWLHMLKCKGSSLFWFILDDKFPRSKTDSSGKFFFKKLPPGEYAIVTGGETTPDLEGYLKDVHGTLLTMNVAQGDVMDLGGVQLKQAASTKNKVH